MSWFRRSAPSAARRQVAPPESPGQVYNKTDSLLELAVILGQQNDFQEILRLATSKAHSLFDADIVSIVMYNPLTQDTTKTIIRQGEEIDQKGLHFLQTNIVGWVMRNRAAFISAEIAHDPRFVRNLFEETPIRSAMCMPLQSERVIHGHVIVLNREKHRAFEAEDLSLLEKFVAVCAPFLSNAQKLRNYFDAPLPDGSLCTKYESLGLLGRSQRFKELLRAIDAAAKCDVRVFLEGQSGTGKELIAKAIHRLSSRCQHPFVAIDCGAIPENLVESELFGHVKGAFTGAAQSRRGLIEEANSGTLFMDEVSNLPHDMQAKLLRVLQEGEVRPVGSNQPRKADVRIIAASSGPIWKSVEAHAFREDLYYRLHVYPVSVPTLKDRSDDIPMLANHFLAKFAGQQQKPAESFHGSLLHFMQGRCWSGNVRELENFVERLVTLASPEMTVIDHSVLPREYLKEFKTLQIARSVGQNERSLEESVDEYEEQLIRSALVEHRWNQSEAARSLKISERAMRYKMEKLRIARP